MADFKATDLKLYVKASAPSTADISTDYTLLGALGDINLDETFGEIDVSTKDDGDNSAFVTGRSSNTLSFSALYDKEDNAGQGIINDVRTSTTRQIWFLVSSNTTGDNEWYGDGILTGRSLSFPDNDTAKMDVTIRVNGALNEQVAASTT